MLINFGKEAKVSIPLVGGRKRSKTIDEYGRNTIVIFNNKDEAIFNIVEVEKDKWLVKDWTGNDFIAIWIIRKNRLVFITTSYSVNVESY